MLNNFDAVADAGRRLQHVAHSASLRAGWWHDLRTGKPVDLNDRNLVPAKLMLVVSEIAEAMEGDRKKAQDDKLPHRTMLEVELADAVIRIADLAGALGLDLGGAIAEKLAFNTTRADHKVENRLAVGGKGY